MRYLKSFALSCVSCFMFICSGLSQSALQQDSTSDIPEDMVVNWRVQTNYLDGGNRARAVLTLINRGDTGLKKKGWVLYFNFLRMINPKSLPPNVKITHINGNLFKLEPTQSFKPLSPGGELVIPFELQAPVIKKVDVPSGFYFVGEEGTIVPVSEVNVAPFIMERQTDRGPGDHLPFPTPVLQYDKNVLLDKLPADSVGNIVPTPLEKKMLAGEFLLDSSVPILYEGELKDEAQFLSEALRESLGIALTLTEEKGSSDSNAIILKLQANSGQNNSEGYELTVNEQQIEITGSSPAGAFYGIQTLRTLLPPKAYKKTPGSVRINAMAVKDAPRFSYRGLHLDVARNFQSASAVKKLIDVMALYKLNKFHFHLTDDEGWRLAIEELPELTNVGGRRGHTTTEGDYMIPSYGSGPTPAPEVSRGSGWYSRETFIDILKYARERYVEVIPEINAPGHARAAITAMKARYDRYIAKDEPEQADRYRLHEPGDRSAYQSVQNWDDNVVNVCQQSTYRFLETVIEDIVEIYAEAGVPLQRVHVGGDEVPDGAWLQSPGCKKLVQRPIGPDSFEELPDYFFRRYKRILDRHNLLMAGWEEVVLDETKDGGTDPDPDFAASVQPYVWKSTWGSGTEEHAYKLANAGYKVIMAQASTFYFDLAYNKHPREPGLYWAGFVDTRDPYAFIPFDLYKNAETDLMGKTIEDSIFATATRLRPDSRENILGLQGQLWGETLTSRDRLEYMAIPRLLSLAERAWSRQPGWVSVNDDNKRKKQMFKGWNEFANRVGQRELPRLDYFHGGFAYRLPPPGAIVENGMLKANVALPGLTIRYTLDGSEPSVNSPKYTGPVSVAGIAVIKLRTFSLTGRGSRTVSLGSQ